MRHWIVAAPIAAWFVPAVPVAAETAARPVLEVGGASLVADYAVSEAMSLKSVTAYREVARRTHIDLDGTGYGVFGVVVDQDQEQFSQEVQLSVASGAGHRGLLGAYWFSEDDVSPDGIRNTEPIDFAFGGGFFLPYNTVSENDQSIEAAAVFGEVSWPVGPSVELTAACGIPTKRGG